MHARKQLMCPLNRLGLLYFCGNALAQNLAFDDLLGTNFGVPNINRTFDYVVIGGGTAGLTLASRLSEQPDIQVAVIEAGSFYEISTGNTSQIPANDVYWGGKDPSDTNPLVEWGFTTTPQAGINDQIVHYERGKTLGGCTAVNYMDYNLPTAGSLEVWGAQVNDSSFTFPSFLSFVMKSQNFTLPDQTKRPANATPEFDISTLGSGGPLNVGYPNYAEAFSSWVAKGMEAVGILPTNGFTSGALNGSSWIVNTINHTTGLRESSETSFLRTALGRPGFVVYPETMAEKILFNGTSASGVQVNSGGAKYALTASKEVIVSAGSFQSPQILQVSGVGPSDLLSELDIPVVVDLPGVGQGMNDHIFFGVQYRVNVQTASALSYGSGFEDAVQEFNEQQSGILSNSGGDFFGYERIPQHLLSGLSNSTLDAINEYPEDWPDFEFLLIPAFVGDLEYPGRNEPEDGYQYATLAVSYMKPQSRGNISISSPSVHDQPLINPNWLTSEVDQELAIAAFKRAREIFEAPVMVENLNIGPEYYPGANVSSDEDILRNVRKSFNTVYHATSTCKMGSADDHMAVVDSKGRVFGAQNLRVVDASTLPFLPPGLPMSVVYGLAEKIAEDIKADN